MLKKSNRAIFKNIAYTCLRNLLISSHKTPNPNFLKFVPTGKTVMENGTMDYAAARYTFNSPLARKLFAVDGVNRVFYGHDHISVGKKEDAEWNILKPEVFSTIQEHFQSEEALFTDEPPAEDTMIKDDDPPVIIAIKEILETRVRPLVQEDGGDIVYKEFDEKEGIVRIIMKGSCSGCPSSSITLKNGIERMLVHYVPEVKLVEAVDFEQKE